MLPEGSRVAMGGGGPLRGKPSSHHEGLSYAFRGLVRGRGGDRTQVPPNSHSCPYELNSDTADLIQAEVKARNDRAPEPSISGSQSREKTELGTFPVCMFSCKSNGLPSYNQPQKRAERGEV